MKRFPPGRPLSSLNEPDWFSKYNQLEEQNTFFPRSIDFKDIDEAVYNWFNSRNIVISDREVPSFFLSPEKWAEFKSSWEYMDEDRNVDYPYITIRRSNSPRLQSDPIKARIPGKTFTTYKQPYYDQNGGATYKLYKVPQPIKVEMEYEIHVLTHYTIDINIINEILLKHFASLQAYLDIDKHFMPMTIDNISDETDFDNIEEERILHTLYSIMVDGYIIDESEFEEVVGVSSLLVNIDEETN